ncbi:hypothetical protein BT69DRAFT_266413 [Atractiella rhizophila]|nr:hypothetical protein BT69DRAFT_266413 [Atractiella rhizophila]
MKAGGTIVIYGMTQGGEVPVSMHLVLQNIELKGSTMGSLEEFKAAVEFIGKHNIKPVVHSYIDGLENAEEGFQTLKNGSQFGKVCACFEVQATG